ncbi:MAG: hypothetical protein AABN95_01045, partial [Acidobacteriota bacterium]
MGRSRLGQTSGSIPCAPQVTQTVSLRVDAKKSRGPNIWVCAAAQVTQTVSLRADGKKSRGPNIWVCAAAQVTQ